MLCLLQHLADLQLAYEVHPLSINTVYHATFDTLKTIKKCIKVSASILQTAEFYLKTARLGIENFSSSRFRFAKPIENRKYRRTVNNIFLMSDYSLRPQYARDYQWISQYIDQTKH